MNSEQSKGAEQAAETLAERTTARDFERLIELQKTTLRLAEEIREAETKYFPTQEIDEAGEPQEQLATSGEPPIAIEFHAHSIDNLAVFGFDGRVRVSGTAGKFRIELAARPPSVESLTAETWMETFADEHGRMPTLVEAWNAAINASMPKEGSSHG